MTQRDERSYQAGPRRFVELFYQNANLTELERQAFDILASWWVRWA